MYINVHYYPWVLLSVEGLEINPPQIWGSAVIWLLALEFYILPYLPVVRYLFTLKLFLFFFISPLPPINAYFYFPNLDSIF